MNIGSLSLQKQCMSRPFRNRKICSPPVMAGFKPFGMPICEMKSIQLYLDEYESIRMADYENLSQDVAAEKMGVSRPTFTRVYNSALKKIAKAFAEGLAIEIEGGSVEFEKQWFKCRKCYKLIEGLENHTKCQNCNSFNQDELKKITK
jgi:uncharacterized protein